MTTPRGRYAGWETLPEPRRQRLREWCEDLEALESLIEFRLGIRHDRGPFGPSTFDVMILNAWRTDGPWIPAGRLDLAGEYLEARLCGVAEGSTDADLQAALSVADKRCDAGGAAARPGHTVDA